MISSLFVRIGQHSTMATMIASFATAFAFTALSNNSAQAGREVSNAQPASSQQQTPELRVLDWSLWNIAKYYVEPKRIDPQAMTIAALEGLEQAIPQVLVEAVDGKKQHLRIRVGTAEQTFNIGDIEALWSVGLRARQAFQFVNQNTSLSQKDQQDAEFAMVEGILQTLDPHTNLLRPEAFESMQMGVRGSFGGLGIEIGMRDGMITVIRVIDGNPADKVGMKAGDRIVQIDEESTVTMNLSEAVEHLRGEAGTKVNVYVQREGEEKTKRFQITRDIIKLESVSADILPGTNKQGKPAKIGLIQLNRNFAQTTGKELREKLQEFEQAGVQGLVLDMRGNPGGLLTAAVEVADAFLGAGTIVSTVGSSGPREELKADDRYDFPDVPIVALIDEGSASATEIVAGALRNLGRAVLLGRRTFGKGSVQVLHDRKLDSKEIALKLTVAQYLTPGDISIQSVGVSPDLETLPVYVGEEHIAYFGRKRFDLVREESLESHLTSEKTLAMYPNMYGPLYFLTPNSVHETKNENEPSTEAKTQNKQETKDKDLARLEELLKDPEIALARDLILWAPAANRQDILAHLPQFVEDQKTKQYGLIHQSLLRRGFDWSPGPAPSDGQKAILRMNIHSNRQGNAIRGGETGTVTVSLTNEGSAPAYQVRGLSESDYSYFDERELMFGRIDPGQSKSYELKLAVSEHELSRTDRIDFHVFEQHNATLTESSQRSIEIHTQGLPRPQFAYGFQILDDPKLDSAIRGNADGALQVGERVRLRVHVKNTGHGNALDTWVSLRNLDGEAVFLHRGREQLKSIAPNESRIVDLDFEVRKQPADDRTDFQLTVSDAKIGEVLAEKIAFPLNTTSMEFSPAYGGVLAEAAIDLYASPIGEERVVASASPGAKFKLLEQAGGWYRIQLDPKRFAFAKQSDVKVVGRVQMKDSQSTDILAVSPPVISLATTATQTDQTEIQIRGTASDEQSVRDMFITVYNPSRNPFGYQEKVFYKANPTPNNGKLEFTANVPLTPGNNLISIHVRESEDVLSTSRMWVLRTSGLTLARANEAKHKTKGQLPVDTLR